MSNAMKSLVFAAVMCLVCSILLTAAATGLKGPQLRNVALDRQKNILTAVGQIADDVPVGPDRIQTLYARHIKTYWLAESGDVVPQEKRSETDLPLYIFTGKDAVEAYVVPIDTRGLWGKIHGYLAIDNDGSTVRGFTVYKHAETPGLGGEIESRWFRKNFVGKKIVDQSGNFVSVAIAKGAVKDRIPGPRQINYVDGISGATLTGKFLSAGLMDILRDYEPVAIKFRNNIISGPLTGQ